MSDLRVILIVDIDVTGPAAAEASADVGVEGRDDLVATMTAKGVDLTPSVIAFRDAVMALFQARPLGPAPKVTEPWRRPGGRA